MYKTKFLDNFLTIIPIFPRSKSPFITLAISIFLLSIGAVSAQAAEGGYSNYIPGTYGDFAAAVEPSSKWTIRNDFYYYSADGGRSVRSGLAEVGVDLEFGADYLTILYKPEFKLFGASYAFGAFLTPIFHTDIDSDLSVGSFRIGRKDDETNLGDQTFIPGILFWSSGNFHFSLAEYIVVPVGKYDSDDLANTGLNYWTFDTDFAATYFNPETGQDYSINIGYNYNTKNPDTHYQTGEEVHIDYMINQFFSESIAIGIHGFYLEQVGGDSGSGATLGSFKAEAAGIGPAVLWNKKAFGQEISFIAKWLHEYHAERRLEGDHIFASFAFSF